MPPQAGRYWPMRPRCSRRDPVHSPYHHIGLWVAAVFTVPRVQLDVRWALPQRRQHTTPRGPTAAHRPGRTRRPLVTTVRSPDPTSCNPFKLDRLTEELAGRESQHKLKQLNSADKDELSTTQHDLLSLYTPLSHDDLHLSAETFDVEQFLLSRAYTSLPDLRMELCDYLAALKEELVRLINNDYEAFISLSTDLRGEDTGLEALQRPLTDLKAKVLESRHTLQEIQDETKQKLDRHVAIREEKAFLHLLSKISESITRLESLLLISSPEDEDKEPSTVVTMPLSTQADTDADDRQGNRAKHIARVAAEYTQLLCHVSRVYTEPCAFIDESQWSTLSSDLDHLFATTLGALMGRKEQSGRPIKRDAEDVIRCEVLREFIKKMIYPGALSAPRSPIVPHTPLPVSGHASSSAPPQTASLPPRAPYKPFTAFASKQNPFEFTLCVNASATSLASAAILDEMDDVLRRARSTRVMEIAEAVCVKSGSRTRQAPGGAEDGQAPGFEIMANVVWAEVGHVLMDKLGSVIFVAGKLDKFRKLGARAAAELGLELEVV
ncbi:oligomeric golgi complex component, COG2-domain-containing protein [Trametes meyenii]|nr:oligomeric golgi complex component, COG2-domain-containing protein [Trametes meyenii]